MKNTEVTIEILKNLLAEKAPNLIVLDIETLSYPEKLLKRVQFCISCGSCWMMADPKTGHRYFQFEGVDGIIGVNPLNSFAKMMEEEAAEKAARKAEREAKKAAEASSTPTPRVSLNITRYPFSVGYTPISRDEIRVGMNLLVRYGNGTQVFHVDFFSPTGTRLEGRRLRNRGIKHLAGWFESKISLSDPRILGVAVMSPFDPKL